jgi:hypothetical protein
MSRPPPASRSSYRGDYTNPILKPWAADIVKKHGEISLTGMALPERSQPVLARRHISIKFRNPGDDHAGRVFVPSRSAPPNAER